MGRRHQIDVFRALLLQFQKYFAKALCADDFPGFPAGYGLVLTVDAAKAAAGKEDGAGTALAGDAGFFPHVERGSGDGEIGRCVAAACPAGGAVDMTEAGTEGAGGQEGLG